MKQIIKLFKENNYQLWQVGGSVRDELLGRKSNDIDFATNATPEQMLKMSEKHLYVWFSENGKTHGTIIFQEEGIDYEITTFRKDITTDGRNATVTFAKTIEEDLARRDFTINAMAICTVSGKHVDPFNGQEDIKNKCIRFVGDARTRFLEDHLRLIRAYRFLSQLGKGWKFVDGWIFGINDMVFLEKLSKERIRDELIKMFKYNPCFVLYHMPFWLFNYILKDLISCHNIESHGHYHAEDINTHLLFTLATCVRLTKNPLLRLACFLHDIGKYYTRDLNEWNYPTFKHHAEEGADIVEKWMKEMKFSNKDIHYVTQLVREHMSCYDVVKPDATNRTIKRFVMRLGEDLLEDMCLLNYCDRTGNLANTNVCGYEEYLEKHTILNKWEEIKEKDNCFKVTDLKINGKDLIELGVPQGKQIGEILQHLFNCVENGKIKNEKSDLLELAIYAISLEKLNKTCKEEII